MFCTQNVRFSHFSTFCKVKICLFLAKMRYFRYLCNHNSFRGKYAINMLQQFTVDNFLSFKEQEVFKLKPGRGTLKSHHKVEPVKGFTVLKTAIMFGANASGKSNFVKAIDLGKSIVLEGTPTNSPMDYHPFRLHAENKKKDTTFIYVILCNNKKYEFGFSYNAERVSREWLKQITKKTEYIIYDRNINEENPFNISYLLKLNKKEEERQFLSVFAKATPPRQLFLHEVLARNVRGNVSNIEDLDNILKWFINTLKTIFPATPYKQGSMLKAVDDDKLKEGFGAILRYFDTGIETIDLEKVDFEKLGISQDLKNFIKTDLSKSNTNEAFGSLRSEDNLYLITMSEGEIIAKKLMIIHKRIDADDYELFSIGEESDGTQRLFDFIPLILDFIQGDKVFIIDEMERSLHPALMLKLIELYFKYSEEMSTQLIFTTHNSSLMSYDILRSDEIWTVNKSVNGISSIGRFDETFNPRFDKILQPLYLKGEFKGVPRFDNEELIKLIKLLRE